jgi:hypothetical protein
LSKKTQIFGKYFSYFFHFNIFQTDHYGGI